jgi:hypothetical protein
LTDREFRERLWKALFGDAPMPEPRVGAVDEGLGLLDHGTPLTEEEMDEDELNIYI